MRVATLNIQSGKPNAAAEAVRGSVSEAVAARVAELDLDVLALQEVRIPHGVSEADSPLGRLLRPGDLNTHRFAPARRFHTALFAALRGRGRTGYGIALATRLPVRSWKTLRLPSWRSPIRRDPEGRRGIRGRYIRTEEQRMALVAVLEAEGPILVCATHLSASGGLNLRQIVWLERRLARIARRLGIPEAPRLLLGDLNMGLAKVREKSDFDVLAEGLTFPEDRPAKQIDHILGRGFAPRAQATVFHLPISDHAGMVADVEAG